MFARCSTARVCSDVTHLLHQITAVWSQVAYADTDGDVIVNVDGASGYAAAIAVIPPTVDWLLLSLLALSEVISPTPDWNKSDGLWRLIRAIKIEGRLMNWYCRRATTTIWNNYGVATDFPSRCFSCIDFVWSTWLHALVWVFLNMLVYLVS